MFQKTRSIASIFFDAYQLYTENFKQLFRASWPIAVIYALVFALATFLFISDLLPIAVSLPAFSDINWGALFVASCLTLAAQFLFILAALLLASTAFWACRSHKATGSVPRPAHWWGVVGHMARSVVCQTAAEVGLFPVPSRSASFRHPFRHLLHNPAVHRCAHALL